MMQQERSMKSNAATSKDSSPSDYCDSACQEALKEKEKACKERGYDQLQCAYWST